MDGHCCQIYTSHKPTGETFAESCKYVESILIKSTSQSRIEKGSVFRVSSSFAIEDGGLMYNLPVLAPYRNSHFMNQCWDHSIVFRSTPSCTSSQSGLNSRRNVTRVFTASST